MSEYFKDTDNIATQEDSPVIYMPDDDVYPLAFTFWCSTLIKEHETVQNRIDKILSSFRFIKKFRLTHKINEHGEHMFRVNFLPEYMDARSFVTLIRSVFFATGIHKNVLIDSILSGNSVLYIETIDSPETEELSSENMEKAHYTKNTITFLQGNIDMLCFLLKLPEIKDKQKFLNDVMRFTNLYENNINTFMKKGINVLDSTPPIDDVLVSLLDKKYSIKTIEDIYLDNLKPIKKADVLNTIAIPDVVEIESLKEKIHEQTVCVLSICDKLNAASWSKAVLNFNLIKQMAPRVRHIRRWHIMDDLTTGTKFLIGYSGTYQSFYAGFYPETRFAIFLCINLTNMFALSNEVSSEWFYAIEKTLKSLESDK